MNLQVIRQGYHYPACLLMVALMLPACAAFQASTEIQSGRLALMTGKPQVALAHFNRAAELSPDYITGFTPFKEGVWTYVGRASYETENYPAARQALERASARYSYDHLAKIYLGLTLAREGDRQRAQQELERGMKGLNDWLENISQMLRFSTGQYWDPQREIRSELQAGLAGLSSQELDWTSLIARGETVGKRMEEEIDRAAQAERFFLGRDSGGRSDSPR
jgi:tetratricopeptide (TPR) repeat protein